MSKKVKTLSTNKKETTATHNSSNMDINSLHRQSLLSQDLSINIYAKDSLENSVAEYTIEVKTNHIGLSKL
jgi:gamma-glutamyl-gamma-aminobutyrate hydrolase PuuD